MAALLKEHVDTFAWSCQDMPGSDTDVVVYKLPWREDCPLEKQNADATYQRALLTLFHDMIHHEIECYVDDMIAKSQTEEGHLVDLAKLSGPVETIRTEVETIQAEVEFR